MNSLFNKQEKKIEFDRVEISCDLNDYIYLLPFDYCNLSIVNKCVQPLVIERDLVHFQRRFRQLSMTTKQYRRHFSFLQPLETLTSSEITTTTSSGYSTDNTSVLTNRPTRWNNFVKRLKQIILPTKSKHTSVSSIEQINFDHISIWLDRTSPPMMKKTPKRSTSLVSTLSRPVIERRSISPTASFSSSILMQGMSENLSHLSSRTNVIDEQLTSNHRRRIIDFSRRRTVAGLSEQTNNKENSRQQIYRFPSKDNNTKNSSSQKYFFHRKTNDVLLKSYGIKPPDQPIVYSSKIVTNIQPKKLPANYTSDSLEDLLCDREVESYFYPSKSQHIYVNIQGTLC